MQKGAPDRRALELQHGRLGIAGGEERGKIFGVGDEAALRQRQPGGQPLDGLPPAIRCQLAANQRLDFGDLESVRLDRFLDQEEMDAVGGRQGLARHPLGKREDHLRQLLAGEPAELALAVSRLRVGMLRRQQPEALAGHRPLAQLGYLLLQGSEIASRRPTFEEVHHQPARRAIVALAMSVVVAPDFLLADFVRRREVALEVDLHHRLAANLVVRRAYLRIFAGV